MLRNGLRTIREWKPGTLIQIHSAYKFYSANVSGTSDWINLNNKTIGVVVSQYKDHVCVFIPEKKCSVLVFDDTIQDLKK